jgi:hypothetical protein
MGKSKTKVNGAIIYRGPSMLDGAPIVVVATGLAKGSNNTKTGAGLIQTWILRDDVSPTDAVNGGQDASICGACPHRGDLVDGRNVNRSCYVTVFQAPLNVWKSAHRGIYADVSDNLTATFAGRGVRLGAYGDPAAVPLAVWHAVLAEASFWTGYTHQWKDCDRGYADYCMASAVGGWGARVPWPPRTRRVGAKKKSGTPLWGLDTPGLMPEDFVTRPSLSIVYPISVYAESSLEGGINCFGKSLGTISGSRLKSPCSISAAPTGFTTPGNSVGLP